MVFKAVVKEVALCNQGKYQPLNDNVEANSLETVCDAYSIGELEPIGTW